MYARAVRREPPDQLTAVLALLAAPRYPKHVRLLRICSRTTLASDGYRSSGGGLVDHAFAAQPQLEMSSGAANTS